MAKKKTNKVPGRDDRDARRSSRADDDSPRRTVDRVQTGVRLEKRILLVLKAIAGAHDLTLGDLLEGIVLHAFEGKVPFGPESLAKIDALRGVYQLDLTAADSHLLVEKRRRGADETTGGRP